MTRRWSIMVASFSIRSGTIALLLGLAACNGIYLGDNPGHEFPKQTGPLTVPPKALENGATP